MTLTSEERQRFAAWLEHNAADSEKLIEQMKRINVPQAIIASRMAEVNAQRLVVNILRSTESVSL